ncbi:hypothetical protein OIE69_39580 [Actinacidiphila glaucinigra]|uniref:hypothetical protein n=1 Tax=Actinacidiphila glaucinigra TaxID=235986 RepID=UPI002DDAE701|nr:hypothetical protein [Actinacidiphila glaucinigra]WSD64565.1 hypothetical protein OIE69_39580 [Actinacidiphila glaucinigra]
MPDLLWDDVQDLFDPHLTGSLPDVCVPGTTAEDWQAVFHPVRARGWAWTYAEGGVAGRLPRAAEVLVRQEDAETATLHVSPVPDVLAVFRLFSAGEVGFDVDLRELRGQRGVDVLCAFLRAIGRRLRKPVLMSPEGDYGNPVLGFDPAVGRVVLLVDPRSGRELT